MRSGINQKDVCAWGETEDSNRCTRTEFLSLAQVNNLFDQKVNGSEWANPFFFGLQE